MKLKIYKIVYQVVWLLTFLASVARSEWVDITGAEPVQRELEPGEKPLEPVIEINAFDSSGDIVSDGDIERISRYSINITLPGFLIKEEEIEGEIYNHLTIPSPGWINSGDIGKPSVPFKFFPIMIPSSTEPLINVTTMNEVILDQINIFPQQAPLMDTLSEIITFQKDTIAYKSDQLFPPGIMVNSSVAKMRNHRFVGIDIAPILVNPLRKELYVSQIIELEIILEPSESPETRIDTGLSSYAFEKLLRPNLRTQQLQTNPETYMMIIHDDFAQNSRLREFIDWKIRKGNLVIEILTSDINKQTKPTAHEIRDTIIKHIPYPTYLLIVGDSNHVAACSTWYDDPVSGVLKWWKEIPNDFLYACQEDPLDWIPDLFYGRLPAGDNSELSQMLDKILLMDENPPEISYDFYNKAISAGMNQGGRTYLETMDAFATYFRNDAYAIDYEVWHAWADKPPGANYLWPVRNDNSLLWNGASGQQAQIGNRVFDRFAPTNDDAIDTVSIGINNGTSIVFYRGHGFTNRWSAPEFSVTHIYALRNNIRLPMILSVSCNTGRYHVPDGATNNFARRWINHDQNGGAYMVIGATTGSVTFGNERFSHGLLGAFFYNHINPVPPEDWYIWFNTDNQHWHDNVDWWSNLPLPRVNEIWYLGLTPGSATKLGQMKHFGKMYTLDNYGVTYDYKNIAQVYHLFGDPEAEVVFHPPENLVVSHPEIIPSDMITDVTINANGGVGELLVSLYSDEILGPRPFVETISAGQVDFTLDIPDVDGEIAVTITGFGAMPYEGVIKVRKCELYIKNLTINSDKTFVSLKNLFAGPNVQIVQPADVTFVAGEEIKLLPGFTADIGSIFKAFIDPSLYDPTCD